MLRRNTPSSAQLTGGDLSVDILHTEDSVTLGDGTNLIGTFALVESKRALPTQVLGVSKTKITDSTETDYAEIEDVGGEKALKVSVIASVGGGGGGTAATDSAAFTATASQGTPVMGAYDDTASDALAEGEMGIVRVTSGRALHVAVQNTVPVSGTFWQATQPVSGTVSVTGVATDAKLDTIIGHVDGLEGLLGTTNTNTGNAATSLAILDDWDATAGSAHPNDGVMAMGSDGTNARRLLTSSAGRLSVEVNGSVAVTGTFWQATQPVSGTVAVSSIAAGDNNIGNVDIASIAAGDNNIGNVDVVTMPTVTINSIPAGTNNIGDVDVLSLPALPAGTNNIGDVDVLTMPTTTVQGAAAHDAGISGQPVPVGMKAINANPTAVSNGDVCYPSVDLLGKTIVTPVAPRDLVVQATGSQATTTETTILAAGGAGVFHDMTLLILTNSNTTTAAQVQIRDTNTPGGTIRFEQVIPPNSGMVVPFPVPMTQTTANNAWSIDLNAAVSTVYWTAQWVKRTA